MSTGCARTLGKQGVPHRLTDHSGKAVLSLNSAAANKKQDEQEVYRLGWFQRLKKWISKLVEGRKKMEYLLAAGYFSISCFAIIGIIGATPFFAHH